MNDVMAKSLFLGEIQDTDYAHIVDMLMDSSHCLEHCMQRVLDKFNMLDAKKTPKGRHANSAKKDDKKRNHNGKKGDKDKDKKREKGENRQSNNTNSKDKPKKAVTYEMIKKTPYFKERDEFAKLSQKEKDDLYDKIHKWFDKNPDARKGDKPSSLKWEGSKTRYVKKTQKSDKDESDGDDDD